MKIRNLGKKSLFFTYKIPLKFYLKIPVLSIPLKKVTDC